VPRLRMHGVIPSLSQHNFITWWVIMHIDFTLLSYSLNDKLIYAVVNITINTRFETHVRNQ
jgi:hypothetical protein